MNIKCCTTRIRQSMAAWVTERRNARQLLRDASPAMRQEMSVLPPAQRPADRTLLLGWRPMSG
jgi:hypothetical protein